MLSGEPPTEPTRQLRAVHSFNPAKEKPVTPAAGKCGDYRAANDRVSIRLIRPHIGRSAAIYLVIRGDRVPSEVEDRDAPPTAQPRGAGQPRFPKGQHVQAGGRVGTEQARKTDLTVPVSPQPAPVNGRTEHPGHGRRR